ncbi:MAG TPA: B-4DMT family transporter [Pseudonocardiaceae bacterium]|jgi:hypothetical protein|nr:B-4DMT family transporter [Pseudonocardiaceae bacterium]
MQPWLVRGVAMAVINAVAQTVLAKIAVDHPTSMTVLQSITIAVLVGIAGLWGGIDGWLKRNPSRGMHWFYAALIGGFLSGVLGVIGQGAFVDQTGVSALGAALTGGAAFTALLILIPAALGLAVGSRLEAPGRADDEATDGEPVPTNAAMSARAAVAGQGRRSVRSRPRG